MRFFSRLHKKQENRIQIFQLMLSTLLNVIGMYPAFAIVHTLLQYQRTTTSPVIWNNHGSSYEITQYLGNISINGIEFFLTQNK